MPGSIKLFQSVQNSYQTMGIDSPHSNQIYSLNCRKVFILSTLAMTFISRFGYFVLKAKFAEENGFESFYETFLILIVLGVFLQEFLQMPEIFQLINTYDDFINSSKSAISFDLVRNTMIVLFILNNEIGNKWHLYHGLDVKIEKMSNIMHFAFIYVIFLGTVGFLLLMTLVKYFIFDLGTESYQDLLLMYVTKNAKIETKRLSNISVESIFVRVPFDWKNPLGYFFILTIQAVITLTTTYPCKVTICFLIGSFWALLTIVEDITSDLHGLNAKRRKLDGNLKNIIHQFSNLKKLSDV